jgi:hypothetical protein
MKPTFKHNVRTFKGINRKEGLTYCRYNNGNLIIAKTLPKREATAQNHTFGTITKHLHELYKSVSPGYKLDLSNYAILHSQLPAISHKLQASGSALFTGMMWKLKHLYPEIDMATITKEDILKNEYPVRTVRESMENGLLLEIPEAMMLEHKM